MTENTTDRQRFINLCDYNLLQLCFPQHRAELLSKGSKGFFSMMNRSSVVGLESVSHRMPTVGATRQEKIVPPV